VMKKLKTGPRARTRSAACSRYRNQRRVEACLPGQPAEYRRPTRSSAIESNTAGECFTAMADSGPPATRLAPVGETLEQRVEETMRFVPAMR